MEIEQEYFRQFIKWYTEDVHGPKEGGQTTLAQEYGCSNQYINMIVAGKKKPSYKTQMRFAAKLKYTREEALKIGENKMKGYPQATIPAAFFDTPVPQNASDAISTVSAEEPPPQRPKTDIEIQADKNHQELVCRFENKEMALKINQLLVRIEQLENNEGLKAALEWAEYRVHQAEKKRGLINPANGTEGK